ERVVPVHVLNREHVLEHPLQPDVGALGTLPVRLQEGGERPRLDVQEMRHRHPLVELREREYRQRLRGHVATSSKCEKAPAPDRNSRPGVDRGARASEQECVNPHMSSTKEDPRVASAGPYDPPRQPPRVYFSSTTAPCASSFFLISSASCLDTPSFTVPGAPSTKSLASFSPRLVIARISLMTWIFFSPPLLRTTVNSVCSSAAGAAAAPPAAGAAAATGAAMVTPNFVLNASISSARSNTDMLPMASRISSLLNVCVAMCVISYRLRSSARGARS